MMDSPSSQNLTTNHHVVKDPTASDMDFESLCLFLDVKVPQNSEIPNFTKYGGDGDPRAHTKIFYNELGAYGKDEHLIMSFSEQFVCILDRIDLMDMKRRQQESFGKYARHWRNVAVKVEPPMTCREMVKSFIRALEEPFHEKLSGLVNHHFSDVVEQGHAIDNYHALRHEIQDLIDKGKFIPLLDEEQAYDPSINTISGEENLDNAIELTIPESEIIEKFSPMHLRLKGKTLSAKSLSQCQKWLPKKSS
ncbi:hypothetical protein ACH5RR_029660 [Cinchona calisaya]|uniref:Retrotransposon gag domain-containing protein n=1 Tax=Cinchona calisaya TaxID=153742 RepID=A0ABD2YTU1_9GENT